MFNIVVCGSNFQIGTMVSIKEFIEKDPRFSVTIPDPNLDRAEAYMRHIAAIKNSNLVVILPKDTIEKVRHRILYRGSVLSDIQNRLESFILGEETTYELCTAVSLGVRVCLLSTNKKAFNHIDWDRVEDEQQAWLRTVYHAVRCNHAPGAKGGRPKCKKDD